MDNRFPQIVSKSGSVFLRNAIFLSIALVSPAFAEQESLPQLVKRVKPAVVAIITFDNKGQKFSQGSGFFIAPNQVVTNRHVIEVAYSAEIRTYNRKSFRVQGVFATDDEGDLATLRVNLSPADEVSPLTVTKALPQEGERVFVIGNPLGLEGTISDGLVSAVRQLPKFSPIIQITAPIS